MKMKNLCSVFFFLLCIVTSSFLASAQTGKYEAAVLRRAQQYEPALLEAAAMHEVDAKLLWVIAYLETRFHPAAVSRKGARGLMQFMPATAAHWGLRDPHNPLAAIDAAARYVRYLQGRFGEQPALILAAYNAGESAVEAYLTGQSIRVGNRIINAARRNTGGIPPYRETQNYVNAGLRLLSGNLLPEQAVKAASPRPVKTIAARKESKPNIAPAFQPSHKSISFTVSQDEKNNASILPRRSISFW